MIPDYRTAWKKIAASTLSNTDVEKAFMDNAYSFVANKAGALMQSPYNLGFEIVHKDDDNTKMVGIFAFRVGSDLLYAPAFFLNGEIKGTDLLYRHSTKKFVPLTEDWVRLLMEKQDNHTGEGISRSVSRMLPNRIQFDRIGMVPPAYKSASVKDETGFDFCLDFSVPEKLPDSVLHQYLVEDGGHQAVMKLASMITASYEFANTLITNCPDEETYMPALVQKQAAEALLPEVSLFIGGFPEAAKQASTEFFKRGYHIEDRRSKDKLAVVYQDAEQNLESASEPGIYDVLTADGSQEEAFCAPASRTALLSATSDRPTPCCSPIEPYSGYDNRLARPLLVAVFKKGGATSVSRTMMGHRKKIEEVLPASFETKLASGKAFRIYDTGAGALSEPFYAKSIDSGDGIKVVQAVIGGDGWCGRPRPLRFNDDYNGCDFGKGIIGSTGKLVEVGVEEFKRASEADDSYRFQVKHDILAGDSDVIMDWIEASGKIKQATVYRNDDGEFQLHTGYLKSSAFMSKRSMVVALVGDLALSVDSAEEILDRAESTKAATFFLELPENAEKRATSIRILNEPNFIQDFDSIHSRPVEYPQEFALPTSQSLLRPPRQHIGDAYDPGMGHGPVNESTSDSVPLQVIMTSSPEQLAQISQQGNFPSIFEHGVVGSLVQTYDSVAMVDKYLPKLEDALDCQARLLFLFFWKPQDFEKAYGVDDMADMENQLLSSFKSFGDLVLNLTKKSRASRENRSALGNAQA